MFLAEYDYNEDIAVKKEEAYEDGFSDGFDDGFNDGFNDGFGDGAAQTKMENARALIIKTHFPMKDIAD